jgi:hypothetical protein
MLKILTQVLKADGTNVAQDTIVLCIPEPYQLGQALVRLSFYQSLQTLEEGYAPFLAIRTPNTKDLPILNTIVTLEDGAYSNTIIDTKAKTFLEDIYGEGNVEVI